VQTSRRHTSDGGSLRASRDGLTGRLARISGAAGPEIGDAAARGRGDAASRGELCAGALWRHGGKNPHELNVTVTYTS
jgi:hypothetical protein